MGRNRADKLDELTARIEGPRRILLDLEELDDTELEKIRQEFEAPARAEREEDKRAGTRSPARKASK